MLNRQIDFECYFGLSIMQFHHVKQMLCLYEVEAISLNDKVFYMCLTPCIFVKHKDY